MIVSSGLSNMFHGMAASKKIAAPWAMAEIASHGARLIQSYRTSLKVSSISQGLGRVVSISMPSK